MINISPKKIEEKMDEIRSDPKYIFISQAYSRYAESNIPVEYWDLNMDKFKGSEKLLSLYEKYVSDISLSYKKGTSVCFAGSNGLGKTMTSCCILKIAVQKGYSGLYTTLPDVVAILTSGSHEDKAIARKDLIMRDFLVIDEFDPRFMKSDLSSDLFGVMLESIFRNRSQNKIPTIMCTNSPNVIESFQGSIKTSLDSLISGYLKIIPVMGSDFRKNKI